MKSDKTPTNDRLATDTSQVAEGVALTPEDLNRSRDRTRVLEARQGGRRSKLLWLLTGPGILVLLGENDGPSMISYAASGATYGIGFFLPFIVVTFLASFVVQEMSMRLGAVTQPIAVIANSWRCSTYCSSWLPCSRARRPASWQQRWRHGLRCRLATSKNSC